MKRIGLFGVSIVAAIGLTACSGSDVSTSPAGAASQATSAGGASATSGTSTAPFNKADGTFAQQMIPHHQQAVQMADMALTRAVDPRVKDLAQDIKAAQDPEITTMTGWLRSWGQQVPSINDGVAGGHGGGHGMMSGDSLDDLMKASGPDFDRMFLEMMVEHHEGAVTMARTEQTDGASPDAKSLAAQIIKTQMQEITTMKSLLARL